ncbi:hypothetical protein WJX73_007687 [Symbiochloris irregularis]|uniref:F-box domain-containing protein n=1 Tax=Symbiochloris irregularis TaxID=706552 RepID=A0AAW1NTV1_9CHLO
MVSTADSDAFEQEPVALSSQHKQESSLPPDVWCYILAKLDAKDLMSSAALVCQTWLRQATSEQSAPTLWGRGAGCWATWHHGGQGWQVQHPPQDLSEPVPIPRNAFGTASGARLQPSCIASSPGYCELLQIVDLQAQLMERGVSQKGAVAFLQGSPALRFVIWCGGHSACASGANLKIVLSSKADIIQVVTGGSIMAEFQWQRMHQSLFTGQPPFPYTGGFVWKSGPITTMRDRWGCIAMDLQGYPAGMQYAAVFAFGRVHCARPGFWGPKFAAPELFWAPQDSWLPMRPAEQMYFALWMPPIWQATDGQDEPNTPCVRSTQPSVVASSSRLAWLRHLTAALHRHFQGVA